MPTASTSQILGNTECFEPITSNLSVRGTLAGDFVMINRHLILDLIKLGLWNDVMRQQLMFYKGSVQGIDNIPDNIKSIYKTAYEISQKSIIDQAADRAHFICQSQSMNIFMQTPTYQSITSMMFYGWKKGLKTGMYYMRSKPATLPTQFTVDANHMEQVLNKEVVKACSIDNPDCESCGS